MRGKGYYIDNFHSRGFAPRENLKFKRVEIMNKSKFLKKSLAMLLALMLVLAMIPLSASAAGALPNLDRLYIDDYPVTAEDGVFAFDIGENDEKDPDVKIKIGTDSLTTPEGTASAYIVKGDTVYNVNLAEGKPETIDLSQWGTEADGVVTLTLRVWSPDKTNPKDYTIELTRTTASRVAKVESVSAGDGTYKASFVDNAGTNNIYMDVARNAMEDGSDNAVLYVTPAKEGTVTGTNVTGPNKDGSYTVKVTGDKQTITVNSQSGSVHSEYTIYVTVYDALQTLDINKVAGEFTKDANGVPTTITVTLPESMARDELGYALDSVKLPMNFTVYGDSVDLTLTPDGGTATPFKSGEKIDLGKLVDNDYNATLTLDAAGYPGLQSYDLVVTLEESTNTAIERVQMDEQLLTEVEGTDITVSVPANTNLAVMDVILFTKPDVVSISGFEPAHKFGTSNPYQYYGKVYNGEMLTYNGYIVWVPINYDDDGDNVSGAYSFNEATGLIANLADKNACDLTKGLIVTVTSEAGTTQQYTLRAKPEENRTVAQLKGLILQSPDGTNYEGNIVDHKVVFDDIPYMTIDLNNWKVFAKTNDAATAKYGTGYNTTIINGTTTAPDLGLNQNPLFTQEETAADVNKKNATTIQVVNMNDSAIMTEYHVEVVLMKHKTGKTLNNIDFHTLTTNPTSIDDGKNDQVYAECDTDNLVKTDVVSKSLPTMNTGTITLKPAYSLSSKNTEVGATSIYNIVNSFATVENGVAFLAKAGSKLDLTGDGEGNFDLVQELATLVSNKETYTAADKQITAQQILDGNYYIVVLPEQVAREVVQSDHIHATMPDAVGRQIKDGEWQQGTVYTLKEEPAQPSHNSGLSTISVGSSKLTVDTGTISGTLAFSNTAADFTATGDAEFVTFETKSPYAVLTTDQTVTKASSANQLISGGDVILGAKNQKLIFVRVEDAENSVKVYKWTGGAAPTAADEITSVTVMAEDRLGTDADFGHTTYKLDLHWQAPETKAEITSFTLAGRTGKITSTSDTLGTIDVTVPFNTDLKGLVATFTTSLGAKVVTADGVAMESGKTSLNYNEPVELEVTSEDTHHRKTFTVTVTASNQFDDVTTDKWYYDEVMDAANRGWVNGQGDGKFNPEGTMTRGDFALIVARIMGYNEAEYAGKSEFPDVDPDDYYSEAIAFCKEKKIIDGDDQGYFNPTDAITREQMAKIICNARGLTQVSDPVKPYNDDAKIAQWAKGYVYACQAEGIMAGDESVNLFDPTDNATRAEGAAVLVRAFA